MPSKEYFEEEARRHLVESDLFSLDHPVVPVKTGGRSYGSISRQIVARAVGIPDVPLGSATYVAPYVFVAKWGDDHANAERLIASCSAAALMLASTPTDSCTSTSSSPTSALGRSRKEGS